MFGRDIFVLIDGTGCHLGTGTNVQRLKVLSEGAGYHARYSAGVGVISRTRIRDRIFAPNLEPEAFAIFDRLIDMDLTTQDRLYIIGYSRGAIIARILAMAIASPNALKAIVGSAEVPKSISAKIQFLGLFDPVVGWPRFTWRKVADHEAIFEEKIGYYMEIIALNERRVSFKSDNTLASPKVSKRARSISSKTNVQTKKDRAELRKFLQLRKTRRSVLFPGTHSDIGGQGGDPQTSLHSLLTMLEELVFCSNMKGTPIQPQPEEIVRLLSRVVWSDGRQAGLTTRLLGRLKGLSNIPYRNRMASSVEAIECLKHPECNRPHQYQNYNIKVTKGCPAYPRYPNLQKIVDDSV